LGRFQGILAATLPFSLFSFWDQDKDWFKLLFLRAHTVCIGCFRLLLGGLPLILVEIEAYSSNKLGDNQ